VSNTIQLLVAGIENGLAYGLIALAIALIFKTAAVVNFAQGTLAALSGFMTYWFISNWNLPWGLGALAALVATFLLGILIERAAVRPLLGSGFFAIVIATLALDSFFGNFTEWVFGPNPIPFPAPIGGAAVDSGGVRISWWSIVVVGVVIAVLVFVRHLIQNTELGLAMRAFADDRDTVELMGVPNAAVSRMTWALSTAVGGVVGIVLAPILFLSVGYMEPSFINGLTAAVLGGLTSMGGSVLGGIFVGLVETFSIRYAPRALTAALPLLIVLVILLVRPTGLFTRAKSNERV
jgi:branched-chain amino acid transport system permease protein